VDVDQVVGDQAAVTVKWPSPVDVGRRVPLVPLGLLVEPAHLSVVAVVVVTEVRRVLDVDDVTWLHGLASCGSGPILPRLARRGSKVDMETTTSTSARRGG
jgi:hypothetical protein